MPDPILIGGEPLPTFGTGSSADRVIGSGTSFPAFPGYVQYNGLLLNNYNEYDYYHIKSIEGLDDAEVRDNRQPKTNQDGENDLGMFYGGRTLVINGQIRAYHVHKADDMRDYLKGVFARPRLELPLWFRVGGPDIDRIIYCRKNAKLTIPTAQPTRDTPWIEFQIPLRASDPRILSYRRQSATVDANSSAVVDNQGNYDAKTSIRLYGPATTLKLTRYYNNVPQQIIVDHIAAGDFLEIVGATVKDSSGNNAYGRYSDDSDKVMLGPSPFSNYLDLEGTGTSSATKALIQWRHSSV